MPLFTNNDDTTNIKKKNSVLSFGIKWFSVPEVSDGKAILDIV